MLLSVTHNFSRVTKTNHCATTWPNSPLASSTKGMLHTKDHNKSNSSPYYLSIFLLYASSWVTLHLHHLPSLLVLFLRTKRILSVLPMNTTMGWVSFLVVSIAARIQFYTSYVLINTRICGRLTDWIPKKENCLLLVVVTGSFSRKKSMKVYVVVSSKHIQWKRRSCLYTIRLVHFVLPALQHTRV